MDYPSRRIRLYKRAAWKCQSTRRLAEQGEDAEVAVKDRFMVSLVVRSSTRAPGSHGDGLEISDRHHIRCDGVPRNNAWFPRGLPMTPWASAGAAGSGQQQALVGGFFQQVPHRCALGPRVLVSHRHWAQERE